MYVSFVGANDAHSIVRSVQGFRQCKNDLRQSLSRFLVGETPVRLVLHRGKCVVYFARSYVTRRRRCPV